MRGLTLGPLTRGLTLDLLAIVLEWRLRTKLSRHSSTIAFKERKRLKALTVNVEPMAALTNEFAAFALFESALGAPCNRGKRH